MELNVAAPGIHHSLSVSRTLTYHASAASRTANIKANVLDQRRDDEENHKNSLMVPHVLERSRARSGINHNDSRQI